METEYAWADQNARTDSIEAMPFGFQLRLPTMRSQFALDASSAGAVLANSLSVRDDSAAGAAVGEVPLDDLQRKERIEKRLMAIETAFFEDYGRPTDQASREGLARFMFCHRTAARPLLSAESTGKLMATWASGRECLTLRFKDGFRFQYAITVTGENGVNRDWGSGDVVTFFERHPDAKRLASGRGKGAA